MIEVSTIRKWLEEAKEEGATHMIIVADTFDWENYPVSVMPEENVHEVAKEYDGVEMQKIMEVYSLALDTEKQIAEERAFHWD